MGWRKKWERRKHEEIANAIEEARKVPPRESQSRSYTGSTPLCGADPDETVRKPEWCWRSRCCREAGECCETSSGESLTGKSPLTIDLCAHIV